MEELLTLRDAVGALLDGPTDDKTDNIDAVITAYDAAKSI